MTAIANVDALQAALKGEYAAVYGYGLAAGRLRGAELSRARRDLDAHRSRRDRLRALIVDEQSSPTAAAPSYAVPPTSTPGLARSALAGIEDRLAAVYADLVAGSTGAIRDLGISGLVDAAVRSAQWGGAVPVFPGLAVAPPP